MILCMIINPITVYRYGFLFNCTTVVNHTILVYTFRSYKVWILCQRIQSNYLRYGFCSVIWSTSTSPHSSGEIFVGQWNNMKVKQSHWWFISSLQVFWNCYNNEPWRGISNNVVCATSKASDQPAHMRSLFRAFACRLNILWLLS